MKIDVLKLKSGDVVGIIACSDGVRESNKAKVEELISYFNHLGLKVKVSNALYRKDDFFSGTPLERAEELMNLFQDNNISAIFDISGGDSANQILRLLDYSIIKRFPTPYFGISDLSVILNAINKCSNIKTYHYQIMNLVGEDKKRQRLLFEETFFNSKNSLMEFDCEWIRGNQLEGVVFGGNIRCFLKLMGTDYIPDVSGGVLFLESFGGRINRIFSLLEQCYQSRLLHKCSGIILGTFTELEENNEWKELSEYIVDLTTEINIPVVKTQQLGHGNDSKCIVIGQKISLSE